MATTMTAGDIAFTALQADNTGGGANGDYFQFVLLKAVTAGTTIYFTDSGYRTDSGAFRTNETMVRWVAQADLPAGTLISFTVPGGTSVASTAEWTGINPITGATLATAALTLNATGDNIFALVAPTFGGADLLTGTPIAGITLTATYAATWTAANNNNNTALPPGLTDGVNAVSVPTFDNYRYTGPTSGSASDLRTAINTDTNWTGNNSPMSPHGVASFTVTGGSLPTLNISDVTQAEGTIPGTTNFTFSVTLTAPAGPGGVTFDIATADGTAQDDNPGTEDNDYVAQALTGQTIPAGSVGPFTFTVSVNNDNIREGNETFFVNVTNITGATAGDTQGTGTITDDDTPVLSIADVSQAEGNAGTSVFTFTVSLSQPAPFGGVTFDIATADNSATDADNDYEPRTLTTQTIAEGATSYTFDVTVNGDTAVEPNELFVVNVTNVTGASVGDGQATGTIQNEDVPPIPVASVADVAKAEGNGGVTYMVFTVSLSFAPTGPVTLDYATSNGTATAGSDYLAVTGQLSFAAGETTKTVSVPIVGDSAVEASETLNLVLSNVSGATIGDGTGVGTITNDDSAVGGYYPLVNGSFQENWTDTGRITADDNWFNVPFIVGYLGDISSGSTADVDPTTLTGPALGAVDVLANQNTTGSPSGGVAEFQIANPTIGIQGSGTADAPSLVLYMDSSGRSGVRLQATLRDLDGGADDAAQQINVQYRTDPNGSWTNVPGAHFTDVTTGGSATQTTAVDVVLPAGADNSPTLQIRIMTVNASGNDEFVGIDDIVVSSASAGAILSIADAAAFEGTGGASAISFTVTRAGDTTGATTADWTVTPGSGGFGATAADFASGQLLSGQVSFAAGETSKTITLNLEPDAIPEGDEGFTVTLANASGGIVSDGSAIGTIVNDDGNPPFVTINDVTQAEGNAGTTTFTFTVTRTGGTGAFNVDYATDPGTATSGTDYVATSGTLSFAAGENSKTIVVTVNGDTVGEFSETFAVLLSNATNNAVIADPGGTGIITNDDPIYIHQIQGTAYYSPILAAEAKNGFNIASETIVTIQAVVTAVDGDGPRQGFYLTEEASQWDANPLTSEGIFVMTRNDAGTGTDLVTAAPGLQVGDIVTFSAQVMEYQAFQSMPRTVLVNMTGFTINSSGNALPVLTLDAGRPIPNSILTAVTPDYTDSSDGAGDTFDASLYGLSFWETVEGMLVTIPDMVVADGFVSTSGGQPIFQAYSRTHADADQINSRGGYTIAGDPPLSPPDTADTEDNTIYGGRHVHDGDVNPDIVELDFSGFANDAPAGMVDKISMGDGLGNVTGIVDFDFTDRKLFVTSIDAGAYVDTIPTRETTTFGNDDRALTVATFNVENLDPTDGAARFAAIAQTIATNLNSPDIIIIEEMQDNNGAAAGDGIDDDPGTAGMQDTTGTDASITWQMLVDALNLATGANYQWVDQAPVYNAEGGEQSGNIRVGFLYDTNRVQLGNLAPDATIAERRQYTDRIGDGVRDAGDLIAFSDDMIAGQINTSDWSGTRKSLLGEFTFHGQTVYVTGNHLPAKSGSGSIWQLNQNLEAGQPANSDWSQRMAVAEDVYVMLNHIQSNASDVGIVSGGDFNDFYFTRPLEVAMGYVMPDGTARAGGTRFENLMVADLPEAERYSYTFDGRSQALDYVLANAKLGGVSSYDVVHINTGYSGTGTGANADQSISDHDPAVASFDFRSLSETLFGTPGVDIFRLEHGGSDTVYGLGSGDGFYMGAALDAGDHLDGGDGRDELILQGDYSTQLTLGADNLIATEVISLLSGTNTQFGDAGTNSYSYNLKTVDANVAAGQRLTVDFTNLLVGENVTFDGSAEMDGAFTFGGGKGIDTLTGGAGTDLFLFRDDGRYGASDTVNGGAGTDELALRGNYTGGNAIVFQANTMTNVEVLSILSGQSNWWGPIVGNLSYDLTTHDNNVAAGQRLVVDAGQLTAGEVLEFDGSAENDGYFMIAGGAASDTLTAGAGDDTLIGGLGADTLKGGGGNDFFRYRSTAESTAASTDEIVDFTPGADKIDLSRIDANTIAAGDQAFHWVGSNAFTGSGAASAGELRAYESGGTWFVEGDTNGDGVADLVISLQTPAPLGPTDFLL